MIQFFACAVQETYLGYPVGYFLLFMPMMILGGGLEEIGWRGILQPLLEKKFGFLTAGILEGILWSCWHIPLWFVPNTAQCDYHFAAFTLYCITLGFTLAAAYEVTKSVPLTVLLHAWGNTILGGMYTLTSLKNLTLLSVEVSCVQLILVLGYLWLSKTTFRNKKVL